MDRRKFLCVAASAGTVGAAGCAGVPVSRETTSPTDGSDAAPAGCTDTADSGPQSPYDSLTLSRMPDYVAEYDASVIVQYRDLRAAAQRAVRRALASDGTYRQCIHGRERTDVMVLFSHIERRWKRTGESFAHTYLQYEGTYYGISLVQEGDFVRVDSIPCTAEECPTTPTPPELRGGAGFDPSHDSIVIASDVSSDDRVRAEPETRVL